MIDTVMLAQLSANQEIDAYTVLREYVQVRFLDQLFRQAPPHSLYFKGGTALRLLFGSERFSEDLDFTALNERFAVAELVSRAAHGMRAEFPDLTVRELKTITGYSARITLPGPSAHHPLTIKIDVSMRESVIDPQTSPIQTPLPVSAIPLVEHLSKPEILAEKIRALTNRRKGRDLYDFWYLLHTGTVVSKDGIEQKLAYYHESFDADVLHKAISSWKEKELYNDIAKFLPRSKRRIIAQLPRLVIALMRTSPMLSDFSS
jgi:predicted nucleotidyltransferase component of viral defense system